MIAGLRVPSFTFFKQRDEKLAELQNKLDADSVLAYTFRKNGRLKEYLRHLESISNWSYDIAQKEAHER